MGPAIKNALKGVLGNPMAWAILLGALFSVMQLKLPAPIEKTVWMLAEAASPVALFTIGSVLARGQLQAHERPQSVSGVWPIVILKLVVHPALIMLLGMLLMQLGADLTWSSLVALVLVAALPSASNVSLLAERFGADNLRIARIILITTVIAFFTFSGSVYLLTRVT